ATTAGGGADLYVLNRGSNTVVRIRQNGEIVSARAIEPDLEIPGFRPTGIAVSPDAQTIWVTGTGPGGQGFVLRMDSFGSGFVVPGLAAAATAHGPADVNGQGQFMFGHDFTPEQLLGPLFNARACADCHSSPIAGGDSLDAVNVTRIAHIDDD